MTGQEVGTEYFFVQDDQLPQLKMVLEDQVGPIDLTDAVTVKVYVDFPSGIKTYTMTKQPNQSSSGKGQILYNFQSGDIPDAGRHRMRTVVEWSGSRKETFPNHTYDFFIVTQAFVGP